MFRYPICCAELAGLQHGRPHMVSLRRRNKAAPHGWGVDHISFFYQSARQTRKNPHASQSKVITRLLLRGTLSSWTSTETHLVFVRLLGIGFEATKEPCEPEGWVAGREFLGSRARRRISLTLGIGSLKDFPLPFKMCSQMATVKLVTIPRTR